ncbi:MAG: response regulator [Deltaproteobacteria bacterium]|nr:response regulator [Deltaproteobacteria bacterium]
MRANDMQVIQTRKPHEFEETVTQSDGLHYYISVKVPIFDAFGEPSGVCGISTDITERKRMESGHRLVQIISETLSESVDFTDALALTVRKVCEMTGWGFGEVWVPNSDESGLSLRYCSLCGADRMDECRLHEPNKGLTLLLPGTGLPGRVWALKRVEWVRDVSVDGDVFLRAPAALEAGLRSCVGMPVVSDGRVLAVMVFFMPNAGALGESYVNMLTDVSDQVGAMLGRRLAEVRRREVMRRYEELVNNISVGVYRSLPSPDNKLVEANRAVVDIFEAGSRGEMLAHSLMELCRDTARCMELEAELMSQGHVKGAELDFVTLKGKPLRISITAVKKEDSDGNVYFDGIMEDVSEKRLLEEQFRHAQKLEAVGRLAGGMAHDFNNILTAVIGYANLVKMKCGGNETVSSFARHILTLSDSATALTQGLLAFSRKRPLSLQPVDMNDLVGNAGKMLARLIGEDIEVRINRAEGELMVMADNAQMEQVLMNLATNARDAMPKGGRLTITTSAVDIDREFVSSHGYGTHGAFAQIVFEDTGTGMDKDTCEHIFEPFFTTKEVGKGTGLGLAMVYGTIKQHDGYINVYSEPGSGTTFRIYLPLVAAAKLSTAAMDEPDESCRGTETILLAEDQPDVREITRRLLEEFGYIVIEAANGEEALARFREKSEAIDLLMLDMKMPKKGGSETYEEIKNIRGDTKVIFMSGYSEEIMHSKDKDKKVFDFISKPVSPVKMLRKVREVLDR